MTNLKRGDKFYQVEWLDTIFKEPPFDDGKLRCISFYRETDNPNCGEFIDDLGRNFLYAYDDLGKWYYPSQAEAYRIFIIELSKGIERNQKEIERISKLNEEFVRQIKVAEKKSIKETYANRNTASV